MVSKSFAVYFSESWLGLASHPLSSCIIYKYIVVYPGRIIYKYIVPPSSQQSLCLKCVEDLTSIRHNDI